MQPGLRQSIDEPAHGEGPATGASSPDPGSRPDGVRPSGGGHRHAFRWAVCASLVIVCVAYANHWENPFHFDDDHTIVENDSIRRLSNLPRLLTDPRTASIYPTHAVYRPVTYLTLALDYGLAGGLDPRIFHLSTFGGFIGLLWLTFMLCRRTLDMVAQDALNKWFALFATTLYGAHPAGAQTLNYIIQRAEVWSAVGVVGSVVLFATRPDLRRYGLYLAPGALGILAKTTASIFPVLVLLYHSLVERAPARDRRAHFAAAAVTSIAVTGLCGVLTLSTNTFDTGAPPLTQYLWTQPWVMLRYLRNFVLPLDLSIDPGWTAFPSPFALEALAGGACLVGLVGAIVWLAQRHETAVPAYGLGWFLVALVPVSVFPLGEVTNDHRMFLPFVGLAVATAGIARLARGWLPRPSLAMALAAGVLIVAAGATWQRNAVWASSESVWRDAVNKNPANGRGRMNLGVALMQRGQLTDALAEFEQAAPDLPAYFFLEVNLGVVKSALGRTPEAEAHFQRAVTLASDNPTGHYYYGRWLAEQRRYAEAAWYLERAVALSEHDLRARHALLGALAAHQSFRRLREVAIETLRRVPGDPAAHAAMRDADRGQRELESLLARVRASPSAEAWLDLSLRFYNEGDFRSAVEAARQALVLRPDYAEALNNLAAAHNGLGEWTEAVAAARRAVALKPDFPLARNNLAWALAELAKRER
jgi:protein O-mannosyl-transferase